MYIRLDSFFFTSEIGINCDYTSTKGKHLTSKMVKVSADMSQHTDGVMFYISLVGVMAS